MTFAFNCSAPPAGVHFVPSSPVRGTLDIVWSCFGVLLLSTWGAMPYDYIDISNTPPPRTKWRKFLAYRDNFAIQCGLAILALLMPEVVAGAVTYEWSRSRRVHNEGTRYAAQDDVDWNWTKVYYANMNGFRVEFTVAQNATDAPVSPSGKLSVGDAQELLADTARVGGDPTTKPIYVSGEELLYLRSTGVLESLPSISIEEVNDKDKSNGLLRTLALIQTLWIVLQVIVRYAEKLKVTQLEIVTLAFAVLNILSRTIDWHRPKDVYTATPIQAARLLNPAERWKLDDGSIKNEHSESHSDANIAVACVVGPLFGGLHCLAWHEDFPTEIEKILWRVCSLIMTFLPLCLVLWRYNFMIFRWRFTPHTLVCIYSLTRLVIMVETGRSLFYQSPDTFVSTWAANFPHLG